MDARIFRLGREFALEGGSDGLRYRGPRWDLPGLSLSLPGRFQHDNAACALAAAELLDGLPGVRDLMAGGGEAVRRGVSAARWPARFQIFPGTPPVILDAAHNPAGVSALLEALGDGPATSWVFSALSDKDLAGMARLLAPSAERVVLVPLSHPRAADIRSLRDAFSPWADRVEEASSAAEGLARARASAGPRGRVAAAGSIVLAGEMLALLEGGEGG